MTKAERDDARNIPEEVRPPRTWPLVAACALSIVVSGFAAVESRRNSLATERTRGAVAATTRLVCDVDTLRRTTRPETLLEKRLRDLYADTTPDCRGNQ